jgi:integrase
MKEHNIAPEPKAGKEKHPFTAAKYNRYRSNLVMLFTKLRKMGAVTSNQAELIDTKKAVKTIRLTMTPYERQAVDKALKRDNPNLHRLMHIFFHAGVRRTELMKVQGRHVDLENQRYKATILKGNQYEEVWKVIKDIALPYWKEAMANCGPDDFLFSVGLKPGPVSINPKQITRRWNVWVKKRLFINADFYSLKHSNTTEVKNQLGAKKAAELNSHKSEAMVVKIYDVERDMHKARADEELKSINNPFVANG